MSVRIIQGDCIEVLPTLEADSVDACVCDPPYGLEFMGKEWDRLDGAGMSKPGIGERATEWPAFGGADFGGANPTCATCGGRLRGKRKCGCEAPDWRVKGEPRARASKSGQQMQAWHERWAREVLRVLKPGGHLLAFGGTRTHHRLMCAIEDAGFEIRDTISGEGCVLRWYYGSGFPKGLRPVPKIWQTVERCQSNARALLVVQASRPIRVTSDGARGLTALALARIQPGDAPALLTETGRADGSRALTATLLSASQEQAVATVWSTLLSWSENSDDGYDEVKTFITETEGATTIAQRTLKCCPLPTTPDTITPDVCLASGEPWLACAVVEPSNGTGEKWRSIPALTVLGDASSNPVLKWEGWNVALKPAWEPIIVARRPLDGTVAANVQRWGTGGINVEACRVGTGDHLGRLLSQRSKDSPIAFSASKLGAGSVDERWRTGRWPSNLLFSHAPGCKRVGERRVRGSSVDDGTRGTGGMWSPSDGTPCDPRYADADGLETIAAWACVQGCPVAVLDAQSGSSPAAPARVARKGGNAGALGAFAGSTADAVGRWPSDDGGGASRFFPQFEAEDFAPFAYIAKADRAEREECCAHLPAQSGGEVVDRAEGATGGARRVGVHNAHPT